MFPAIMTKVFTLFQSLMTNAEIIP